MPHRATSPRPQLALPPLPLGARPARLLGREHELALLIAAHARARDGERVIVALAGEPGIGKSRLAQEFCEWAHDQGSNVLAGRSSREALVPYQPFVEALAHYMAARDDATLRSELGAQAGELLTLVPALRHRVPNLSEPLENDEGRRFRIFEAYDELLAELSPAQPAVLFLEDMHWAFAPSVSLLEHLLQSSRSGLVVLITLRANEPGPHSLLLRGERIELDGLHEPQISALIESLAGEAPPLAFTRAVHRLTEGNPFFVEELVRHLLEAGELTAAGGAWRDPQELAIPAGIKAVIGERIARLGADAHRALAIAAVIGRAFDLGVLEEVGDVRGEALRRALEETAAARLITPSDGKYTFSHALVRDTMYERLSRRRRERLHARIAEAIEKIHGAEPQAAALAYHYLHASAATGFERGIAYALAAGDHASDQLAYEEAAVQYERALDALARSDAPETASRCEALLRLGWARWAAGEYAPARHAVAQAAELALEAREPELLARAALEYGGNDASFRTAVVDSELIALLERALKQVPSSQRTLRAELQARLAAALAFTPDRKRAAQLAADAVELARAGGDRHALARVLNAAVWATWGPDGLLERMRMIGEFMNLAGECGDERLLAQGQHWSAASLFEAGRAELARQEVDAHARSALLLRQGYRTWIAAYNRANAALLAGRVAEAEALGLEALQIGQEAQNENAVQVFSAQLIFIRREQLRIDELIDGVRATAAAFPAAVVWRSAVAWVLAESGHEDDARAELKRLAARKFKDIPRDHFWLSSLWVLGEVATRIGEPAAARDLYALLEPYADRCMVVGATALCCGSLERTLGGLAALLGQGERARGHFERALTVNREIGAPLWEAYTACEYAATLVDDPARVEQLLAEAGAAAGALGSACLTRTVERARLGTT
jgi:predicted ATPase